MLKVPRLWTQWIVNIKKVLPMRRAHAVIYVGSDIITLGYCDQRATRSWIFGSKQKTKKRLGGQSKTPPLTQSLTLSHIHRILEELNSSALIAIILPDSLFTRVTVSAPANLAPLDIGPTLTWALEQQGFSPSMDWLWDAKISTQQPSDTAVYEALLIEADTINAYLERLGILRKQLVMLVADTEQTPSAQQLTVCGPWLSDVQIHNVIGLLEKNIASSSQHTCLSLNPVNNLVARHRNRYRQAFYQCTLMLSAVCFATSAWWFQSAQKAPPDIDTSLPALAVPAVHPMLQHAHVWQNLFELNGEAVQVKTLEFRRNTWLLQVEAGDPGIAEQWLNRLRDQLNDPLTGSDSSLKTPSWKLLTTASRSSHGLTQIDLEIHR